MHLCRHCRREAAPAAVADPGAGRRLPGARHRRPRCILRCLRGAVAARWVHLLLLCERGLPDSRHASAQVPAPNRSPPPLAGSLGAAFAAGGAAGGLAIARLQLYLCSLPALLPYAGLAVAYRWALRATAFLWAVFCGRRRLLSPPPPPPSCPPEGPSSPPKAAAAGGSRGEDSVLPQNPSLEGLVASILLIIPLLLLLPTLGAFYSLACTLHASWLGARLAAAAAERALAPGAGARQQQGAGDSWAALLGRPSEAQPLPAAWAVVKSLARGELVGARPAWPWGS